MMSKNLFNVLLVVSVEKNRQTFLKILRSLSSSVFVLKDLWSVSPLIYRGWRQILHSLHPDLFPDSTVGDDLNWDRPEWPGVVIVYHLQRSYKQGKELSF